MAPLAVSSSEPCPVVIDCETLHRFSLSHGDLRRIMAILTTKSSSERKELKEIFTILYKEDLCKFLETELPIDLKDIVSLWIKEPAERDAIIARRALEGWNPDFFALTEILCSRSPAEFIQIRETYYSLFKTRLENDIATEIVGPQQKILFALAKARRCAFTGVDEAQAKADVKRLYDATEGRIGVDESALVKMLSERSLNHLRASFNNYKAVYGHHFLDALKVDSNDIFEKALRIIVECISCPHNYFTQVIHSSLQGTPVDESALARVMITRAEEDMEDIRQMFLQKHEMALENAITLHTCGDFMEFMLRLSCMASILGQQQHSKLKKYMSSGF